MSKFSMLASGSSGNSCLIQQDGFGLLIDFGLGPRLLASRLSAIGANWQDVHAVILTHTHSDHWNNHTLAHFRRMKIPFYCHPQHIRFFQTQASNFSPMLNARLVHTWDGTYAFRLGPGIIVHPIKIDHDSDPTYGFRIEGPRTLFGPAWSLGYAADLGIWRPELLELFQDVELLALEFNHDEHLERTSGRPRYLVERVLSEKGHLSNKQAAEFLQAMLSCSGNGNLQHVVQLHLSSDCNRPALAVDAARQVLNELDSTAQIHTARQDVAGPSLSLDFIGLRKRKTFHRTGRKKITAQRSLPGFEDEKADALQNSEDS